MPRSARLRLPGHPLHIVQRGHNRAACFPPPDGFAHYLSLLEEFSRQCGCAIHAYVLMPNHLHLLATPEAPDSATEMMRKVNQRFVQRINKAHRRTGSLWQGRFRSHLVDSCMYALACHRYIEMNPVRARIAVDPSQYAWSSHAHYALGKASNILVPHASYLSLGGDAETRQRAFRGLFALPLGDADLGRIREALRSGLPVGSAAFLGEVAAASGRRVLPAKRGPRFRKEPSADDVLELGI